MPIMELLVFCFFILAKRIKFYYAVSENCSHRIAHFHKSKGSFLYNFGACVIYAITKNIPFVSEILNKGRVVITAFCNLNIVSELKWLISVKSQQTTMEPE